ncbi:HK97-gp10 family putative phage morphogenesis protein [Psychrobacter sp. S4(2024)]|uniref:HK97-gp10 family putative phage morphogenesis protein n=1 Tax=Psychrobacter sp. S4(2024) TaxID=3111913 RepID=UPI002FE07C85
MSDDFTSVEVLGLDEMERKLGELDNKLAGKAIYGALGYALTPVVKDAKKFASKAKEPHTVVYSNGKKIEVKPGLLRTAIKKRRVPKSEMKGEFAQGAAMGMYIGTGRNKVYPNYWHFIERGTSTQPATPFIRPAFDNNIDLMLSRFSEKLNENIDKYRE